MTEYNPHDIRNYFVSTVATAWLARKNADGTYGEWYCVGDVQEANYSPSIEKLEHESNFFGLNKRDKTIVNKVSATATIQISELVRHNLLYILNSKTREIGETLYVVKQETKTWSTAAAQVNEGEAIYQVRYVLDTDGEDAYEEGPSGDYEVNEATGTLTKTTGTTIADGQEVIIVYEVARTTTKYKLLDASTIEGKAIIVSEGSGVGPRRYLYFPDCLISIDGDIALLSKTEWNTASIMLDINEDPEEGFGNWYNY
jgi:hypothetical protein